MANTKSNKVKITKWVTPEQHAAFMALLDGDAPVSNPTPKETALTPASSEIQKELSETKQQLADYKRAFEVQLKEIERLSDESIAARKEAQELRETGGTERQTKYIQVLLSKLAKYETPAQQGIDQERA